MDHRVLEQINFGDFKIIHLPWIMPFQKESMKHYAKRMAAQIETPLPIIIGLSFGGMIAVEIAKQISCKQIILIASAKTYKELPSYYRVIGQLGLHHFVPNFLLSHANAISHWFFGTQTARERSLLSVILKETDADFRTWAIDALLSWRNETMPDNIIAIHGNKDRIIPIKNVKVDYTINGGGHFMTVSKAHEMNDLLKSILNEIY